MRLLCWGDRVSDRSGDWSGWGVFLCMVFRKDIKDLIWEYSLVVIYVVVGDVFCVYVEFFKCVKVWSFFVVS